MTISKIEEVDDNSHCHPIEKGCKVKLVMKSQKIEGEEPPLLSNQTVEIISWQMIGIQTMRVILVICPEAKWTRGLFHSSKETLVSRPRKIEVRTDTILILMYWTLMVSKP